MSHIFISYSRRDLDFAQKIVTALADNKLDTWIDWKSIPKGEDWEQEIYRGIEEADAFLFLISPDSVTSKMCNKEIACAVKNSKRILPIVIREADRKDIDPEISKRNWVFCRDGRDDFDKAIEETRETIHTDYEWLKYHTELQVKALKWEHKKDNSRLLRGKELQEAEERLSGAGNQKEPLPTGLQARFVLASRKDAGSRSRRFMLGVVFGLFIVILVLVVSNIQITNQRNAALANQLIAQAQSLFDKYPQRSLLLVAEAEYIRSSPTGEESLLQFLSDTKGRGLGMLSDAATSVVISSNSHWIASCSKDGSLFLWDITDRDIQRLPQEIETQPSALFTAIAISDDERQLIVGDSVGDIYVFDLSASKAVKVSRILHGHRDAIVDMQISNDGRWLITSSKDNTARLWNLEKNNTSDSVVLINDGNAIPLIVMSNDGHWAVISGENGTMQIWDLMKSGPEIVKIHNYNGTVTSLSISSDNRLFLSGSSEGTVQIWTLDNLSSSPLVLHDSASSVTDIDISSDNKWLVAGTQKGYVHLWNLSNPNATPFILRGPKDLVKIVAFSRDNHWLFSAGEDNSIYIWSIVDFNPLLAPVRWRGHDGFITDMHISQDNTMLVTGSVDKTVRLWNIKELSKPNISYVALHSGTGKGISLASMSNDGHYLTSLDTDGSIRIWDILSPNPASVPIIVNVSTEQTSFAVNFEKQWLLTSDPLGGVKIWGIQNLNILSKPLMEYGGGRGFTLSHDGRWLVVHPLETCVPDQTGGGGSTPCFYNPPVLYDLEDPTAKEIVLSQDKTRYPSYSLSGNYPLAFSPDAHWLFTENGTTGYLWNLWSDNPIQESTILTLTPVKSVLFSSDGKWLAATDVGIFGYWASIQLWSMDDLSNTPIRLNCQNKDISSITFSLDGNFLVSGNADGEICLWSMKDLSAPPNEIDVPGGKVIALAMDPSNQWLVIGTTDGSVTKISMDWDSKKSVIFRDHIGAISSLFIDPLGKWIISTSDQDDAVRLRALSEDAPTDLLDFACSVAGRNLNLTEWEHYLPDRKRHVTCEEWASDGNLSGWQRFWIKYPNWGILLFILAFGGFFVFPSIYLLFENDPDQKEVEEWMSHHFNYKLQIILLFVLACGVLWPHLIMYVGIKLKRLIKNGKAT